ncbi:hypothetical protein GGU11DRAFT_279590 [Lentinula aff. detonsa]|nr:hypothetical protein GGU11DRAFT_279590 [Lentinula aff. detonsa]
MACMADLPAELLASIFLLAVFACDGVPALRNAPWNVCQTCRLWRSITLNDGRLWAHLQLYKVDGLCYGDEDGQQILIGPDGGLRLLRIWLNRSHNAFLHYFVNDLTSYNRRALHLLLDHQERWKDMGFNLAGLNYWQRIRLTTLPVAESLLVEIDSMESQDTYDDVRNTPHEFEVPFSTSSFVGVKVKGPLFTFPHSAVKVTDAVAPHLTELGLRFNETLTSYNLRLFTMPLLQQCPVLQHLKIDFIPIDEQILDEITTILTLPHLRSLQFFTKYNSFTSFLRHIDAPCLESLDVETRSIYVDGAQRRVVDDVLHVIRKTASTLSNLRFIHDTKLNFYHELFPLIQGTVTQLDVPHAHQVLEYITAVSGLGNLAVFPNLQVLIVTVDGSTTEECIHGLNQLMAALTGHSRLRFVATTMLPEYERDEVLGQLCREGKLRRSN